MLEFFSMALRTPSLY